MPGDITTAGQRQALLGELAELSMSLARRLHGEAMAAVEPEALVSLSNGFQRTARVVRQSLALQQRLELDIARAAREAVRFAEGHEARRVAERKALLKIKLERAIWTEADETQTVAQATGKAEVARDPDDDDYDDDDDEDERLDIYDPQIRVEVLHDLLEEFALCEGFADVDFVQQVRWIRGQLGMPPEPDGPPDLGLRPIPRPKPPSPKPPPPKRH